MKISIWVLSDMQISRKKTKVSFRRHCFTHFYLGKNKKHKKFPGRYIIHLKGLSSWNIFTEF